MKQRHKIIASALSTLTLLGTCSTLMPVPVANASESELYSGYYMASDENNIRSEPSIDSKKLGKLDNIIVYYLDNVQFQTDKYGNTFVELTNIALKNGDILPFGYLCLDNCYYMGDEDNRYVYEVTEETVDAWDSWRNATGSVKQLSEGETFTALDTGDMWIYCPELDAWICSWYAEQTHQPVPECLTMHTQSVSYSYNADGFYNENQETIFCHFIEQGFSQASAAAIAANLYAESGCDPTAWCIDTNGLKSYGICQWNGVRNTRLHGWCHVNGYDADTLKGQLAYLDWELQTYYNGVLDKMQNLPNMTECSYYAGQLWASSFEVCSSKYWDSRGQQSAALYAAVTE